MNAPVIALFFTLLAPHESADDRAALDTLARRHFAEEVVRARCVDVLGVAPPTIVVNGDRARIDVTALADVSSVLPGSPHRIETENAVLEAERSAGGWRITRSRKAEEILADDIVAAPNDDARWKLVDTHPELLTVTLDRTLDDRAIDFINKRQYDQATALSRMAREIANELGDRGGESYSIVVESTILRRRRDPDIPRSVALSRQAIALAEESRDPDMIAQALQALGRALLFDEPVEARGVLEQVVELRPYLETPRRAGLAAVLLGDFHRERGDYRLALHYAEICRAVAVETGDQRALFAAEALLGEIYQAENDCELAIAPLKRSVDLGMKMDFRDGTLESLVDVANCYVQLNRRADFLRTLDEALKLSAGTEWPRAFDADVFLARGRDSLQHGELARAEPDLLKSLESARAGRQKNQVGPVLAELAELRLRQKRYREAIELAGESITEFADDAGYERFEPLVTAARAYRALGQRDAAYAKLSEALRMTEEQRGVVGGAERQRQLFFTSRVPAYLSMIDALIEDGRLQEALRIAEAAKGRTLLDILAGGRLMSEDLVSAGERKREADLRDAVTSAKDEPSRQRARNELESFLAGLYAKYPRLPAQRNAPAEATVAEMGELLHDRNAAFVEYVVEPQRVRIFIIRLRAGRTHVDVRSVPVDSVQLAKKVDRYVTEIAQRFHGYRPSSRALYDLLVAPAAPLLRSARVVCIIPDGPLWNLPFESLIAPDGRAVIDRLATFYAPSITVYRQMTLRSAVSKPKSFLGFAEIPASTEPEREVRAIAGLFPSGAARTYTGPSALESRVKRDASAFDVIHFATHGVLDDTNPMYSHLLLAHAAGEPDDGRLETWEMMQLDLHAQLAVLSACDTGRGVVHEGEGLIGMSWALSIAGCPSTIVSKWRVESRSTASLMIDFYRQWLRPPNPPARFAKAIALRAARLRLRSDGEHRDPYYWSAFVLVGAGD